MFKVEPMCLSVDTEGRTLIATGQPNVDVALEVDQDRFWRWLMPRLVKGR